MKNEVWVVAQMREAGIAPASFEVLQAAEQVAEKLSADVAVVIVGNQARAQAGEFFSRGARKAYVADTSAAGFADDLVAGILAEAIKAEAPRAVFGAATFYGKALFARTAALCDLGLVPDVNALSVDGDAIVAGRPCFGGNVVRDVSVAAEKTFLATVRPKIFPEAQPGGDTTGETVELSAPAAAQVTVKETVSEKGQTVNLNEADVIVAGGRGLREADNFKFASEMADALGGALGASRAVVDAGWIPYAHQIGQTGKTVNPKLYIALGISGAIQHLVGMQSSGVIVAVNKDPDAPIFKVSTFGIVGDLFEYAPAMTRVFKEKLGG
jgi:electron transfer flavoprotein alpha subunit